MLLIYLAVAGGIAVWLFSCLTSPVAKAPGPWYTLFTSFVLKYHEMTANRRLYVHDLHNKYGPVVRLGPNELSFAGVEAAKEIYQSGGSGYEKTEFYSLFTQYGHKTLFSTLERDQHATKKRIFADRYANTNIMRPEVLDSILENAQLFLNKCLSYPGTVADVYIWLHCYALDCVTHHLFHPYGSHSLTDPTDRQLMEELSYHNSIQKNYLRYYSPTLYDILQRTIFTPAKYAPLSNAFVLKSSGHTDTAPFTVVDKLQTKLPPISVAAECMDHMAAGIDTTGDALCFLMYHLSLPQSAAIQKRMSDEMIQNPDLPFDQLHYLEAVVKEGLRVFAPIPMSLPRYVPAGGRTIDGTFVPGGAIVSSQPHTIHRWDSEVFPRPDEFIPERWLSEKGDLERNRQFFAFANGGRGCTGRNLAIAEMKILLREVYSRYSTQVPPTMTASMEVSDQIIASRPKDQKCLLKFTPIVVA